MCCPSLQSEACRALSRGLTALPAADVDKRGLAVVLMTLDGAGQLGASAEDVDEVPPKHRARLSAPGCAMLALLLRFPLVRNSNIELVPIPSLGQ